MDGRHRKESIVAEAEREMMQPVDLGSPIAPEVNEDWEDDDLVDVSMPKRRERIEAVCVEDGIAAFSLYASRKFRRLKNTLFYDSAPIDDSWEYITAEEEQEARTGRKEQVKAKNSDGYHSFASFSLSGNQKPRRARTDIAVNGQETRAPYAEHRTAARELTAPLLPRAEASRKTETRHQSAGFELAPPSRQVLPGALKERQAMASIPQNHVITNPESFHTENTVESSAGKATPRAADQPVMPGNSPMAISVPKHIDSGIDKLAGKSRVAIDAAASKFAEKPTGDFIDKAAQKLKMKSVEKPAEKSAEKAVEKTVEKTVEKAPAEVEKPAQPVAAPVKQKGKQKKKNRKYQDEDWLDEVEALQKTDSAEKGLDELPYTAE
ncbi:hypothetical protein QBC41DRAFT_328216 [Cercophora samala]|uniref:Uncharacterized protein n=1 Tax=Cercophora samala TaxID=330535 RepID=A0AA39Z6M7_9PEZI|nr:hypothetical protein QBC41DRAFT_328216 [Cercophora samala]